MCDKMAVCEEAGRRYRDTCLLLCEKGEKREHMKKFYAWYQKHITGAIFTGLILGILTGLLLADRFTPILTVTGVDFPFPFSPMIAIRSAFLMTAETSLRTVSYPIFNFFIVSTSV